MSISGFILYIVVLIFSVVIHEVSHGYVAKRLGDPTAEAMGRLTLNPVSHLDPVGSFLFPLVAFLLHSPIMLAWAKPVPYNPNNLYKDYKYGPLKVALAGPGSNVLVFLVCSLVARFGAASLSPELVGFIAFVGLINLSLAIFNLVPIPPLDGSKILPLILPPQWGHYIERIGLAGIVFVLVFVYLFAGVISYLVVFFSTLVAGPTAVAMGFEVLARIFGG